MPSTPEASSTPEPSPSAAPIAFQAVRGGLWVLVCSYWNIGFGFLSNIFLTRQLNSEAYGTFALALFFSQLLRIQPKVGLGYAFAQQKETTGELLGSYIPAEIALALAGLILSGLSMPVLLLLGYAPLVVQVSVILSIASLAEGVAGIGFSLCDKELFFQQTSLLQSVTLTVSYLPAFWLATHGGGVWSLVTQTLLYNLLILGGIGWVVYRRVGYLWKLPWQFSLRRVWQMATYGFKVGFAMLTSMLLTQLDNLMIGTFVGTSALGFYDRAYRTAQWPSTLLTSLLARAGFYTYARLQDDKARLTKTVTMVMWAIVMLAFPLALALFVSAPDLVVWLYTDTWLPSAPLMRILLIASIVRPFADNAGALFIATEKPNVLTRYTLIQVIMLVALGLPLTLLWGAYGTALAVAAVYGIGFVLVYRLISRALPINLLLLLGPPMVISSLIILGYFALNRLAPINTLGIPMRVMLKSSAAAGAFFMLTLLTQPALTRERVIYLWRLLRQSAP